MTQVSAVCDLNEKLAKKFSKIWGIPNYYTSFSELLKQEDVDLIDICTPPQVHKILAIQAMESNCHVLVEKPLTMTVKEADEIIACQKRSGVRLGVIHNFLFSPTVQRAHSIVEKGDVGDIASVEVEAFSTGKLMASNEKHWVHALPGGRMGEILPHPIYLIQEFIGNLEVVNVSISKVGKYAWMPCDELSAIFKAGKKLGVAHISFNSPRSFLNLNVIGREAILRVNPSMGILIKLPRISEGRFSKGFDAFRQAYQIMVSTTANAAKMAFGQWKSEHEIFIRRFVNSIIHDIDQPVTVESAFEVVRVLEELCLRIDRLTKKKA